MVSTRASAKSKPRGKPLKVAEPEKPVSQDASTSFVIAPGKVDHVVQEVLKEEIKKPDVVDPTLEFFMMNKAPNPWQKQRAPSVPKPKQKRKEEKAAPASYDLDEYASEPNGSPGGKRKKKDSVLPAAPKTKLPAWAQDVRNISPVASEGDSDIQILEVRDSSEEDSSPRSKRARIGSREPSSSTNAKRKEKGKARRRSSSVEIIEPPTLSRAALAQARAAYDSVYRSPPPVRAPSPDIFADRSTDSVAELNPELQELAKKIKRNKTRATSETPSGKPDIVTIRVVYHPHPQDPPNGAPKRSWTFRMKRIDELRPIFAKVAESLYLPVNRIKICHNGIELFKLATPDSIQSIWADADFDAYLDTTLKYIRENRIKSPSKAPPPSQTAGLMQPKSSQAKSSSKPEDSESDEDAAAGQDDTIKLFLQGSNSNKKIPVKTRRTTTAISLIRHYLRASGAGDYDEAEIKTKKIILKFDGDDVEYDSTVGEIADGELEGEECLDVVGI